MFGIGSNIKSALLSVVVTISSKSKPQMNIETYISTVDETGEQVSTPKRTWVVNPSDWSTNGMTHLRIQPSNAKALGHQLTTNFDDNKVTILDCTFEYLEDTTATIAAARSN